MSERTPDLCSMTADFTPETERKNTAAHIFLLEQWKAKAQHFIAAYDAWAQSPDGIGGELFDEMLEARGELEALAPLEAP